MERSFLGKSFEQHFGQAPEIIITAPGRINVIGEHTDYNGGYVLPAAIDKAIWMAASRRNDGKFVFHALDLNDSLEIEGNQVVFQEKHLWANYLLGVVSEARRDGHVIGGINLVFGGDVPLGAGLSSSAAIESGFMFIINALYQLGLERMEIVRLAQRGENNFVGMKCGIMDMFASVMGRENQVVRLDCKSLEYVYFPFKTEAYCFVLCDSGVKHQLVDSEYNTRREECEAGVALLKKHDPSIASLRDVTLGFLTAHRHELPDIVFKRCKYVVEEIERVEQACDALNSGDFATLGQLMYRTHDGLDLEYAVSVPEINFLVDFARTHGITGARMMGGGFGGCTINLLKINEVEAFSAAISQAYFEVYNKKLKIYPVRISNGTEVL